MPCKGVHVVGEDNPLQGIIMNGSANVTNLLPEQEQEHIGIWIVGPPGSGKTTVCRAVRDALSERRLHIVDSDDPRFEWAKTKTTADLAETISNFCRGLSGKPILACSVEGPPDHDRWIVFGIDRPIIECIKARPEAYEGWITEEEKGPRAIDNWRASGMVHHVLRGSPDEMTQTVVKRIRQEWACST